MNSRSRRCRPRCGGWNTVPAVRRLRRPAVKTIDAAVDALEEADQHLSAAGIVTDFDPAELERIEERAVLAARRGAQIRPRRSKSLGGVDDGLCCRHRPDRCRRRAVEETRERRVRSRRRLSPHRPGSSPSHSNSAERLDKTVDAEPTAQARPGQDRRADRFRYSLAGSAGLRRRRTLGPDQIPEPEEAGAD